MIIDVERQSISDEIWYQNYQGPEDLTIADTWERQARACSDIENPDIRDKVYQDFKWLLEDFKGVAGGRITANLGIQGRNAVTMMNCFVFSPGDIGYKDPDSIEGIYDMLKAQAHTLKSEGGYGMNFSWIRPNGTYIEGIDSRTPGVLSFMELWDTSSKIVTQGSEKVIGAKRANEKKKIRKGAQMGVLECVSGDSLISTIDGKVKIRDLVGKDPYVYCTDCKGNVFVRQASKVWSNGIKRVVKIYFDNDDYIICTPDHEILLSNGDYKQAEKLRFGDSVSTQHLADSTNHKVLKVEDFGEEEVFDMSVPEFHNFVANGVFVHNCWHPEIEDFIDAKLVEGRLSKFNLSVGITDGFMDAVLNDKDWVLKFPDTTHPEFNNWDGDIYKWESKNLPVIVYKTIKAKFLWNKIVKSTYARNDPGVLFLDLANKKNPLNYAERIATSNPCGEVLMALGTCLLFSLNLVKYIKKVQDHFEFDFETFKKAVSIAVRFSDNINDITNVPLPEYKKAMLEKRRMGVGVLSLGSLHYILGIRFGSEQSQKLIHDIFKTKAEAEILASARLGREKGSFPLFDKEKYFNSYWWKTLPISDEVKAEVEDIGEMRNSHRSANAPTGNMSLYVGVVSGGIEPVFMKEYSRWSVVVESERIRLRELGFKFPDIASGQWFETENLKASKAGTDDILIGSFNGKAYQVDKNRGLTVKTDVVDYGWLFVQNNFTKEQIEKMTSDGVFCTTSDLSVHDHINTLKIISPFVDQNSSKTINVPGDYPFDDFEDVYLKAWKSGIKGLTTYRAGTMTAVLEEKKDIVTVDAMSPIKRPKELPCEIHRPKINGQEWGVIVGLYKDEPFEIFAGPLKLPDFPGKGIGTLVKKKRGVYSLRVGNTEIDNVIDYFADDKSAWATRMVSMCLRHGIPLKFISDQLSKDGYITDINNVLARILKKYVKIEGKMKCPSCGSERIVLEEGCMKCLECTYGKCG